ncbi:MAG: glycosyltransferase family 2 protein [Desulfobulbaceae bacterium]|nr:glycosyltransferase family 2 protein [Desulfobulbaceae bacterium]
MQISLIITTYNWKEALRLSLQSVLAQTLLPREIVVADDGSRPDTAELVREFSASSPVPVIHSWQEDEGFRSAQSRNKAISKARGDYIILIDGDIVLESHFVADHRTFAQSGYFVQGTRALLGQELSVQSLKTGQFRLPFLAKGLENKKNCLRSVVLSRLLSFRTRRLIGVKTCNFAFWKQDALLVNGFNEDFIGWGREDSEFAARLINFGIRRLDLKFHALGYHLHHPMNTRDRLAINDAILNATIEKKLKRCERGIDQYLV